MPSGDARDTFTRPLDEQIHASAALVLRDEESALGRLPVGDHPRQRVELIGTEVREDGQAAQLRDDVVLGGVHAVSIGSAEL